MLPAVPADHPLVGEVRAKGLLGTIELVEDKAVRRCFDPARRAGLICRGHCIANGLAVRAVHDVTVPAPPLVITQDQIDGAVAIARRALDLTLADLSR